MRVNNANPRPVRHSPRTAFGSMKYGWDVIEPSLSDAPSAAEQAPHLQLAKDTSLVLPDPPKSTIDVVRSSNAALSLPCETFVEKANFGLQIDTAYDAAEAASLEATGLSGMAAEVRDPRHGFCADMATRFPEYSGTLQDVFEYGLLSRETERYALDTRAIPKEDYPPLDVREALVTARESDMFTKLELVRYWRLTEQGMTAQRAFHDDPYEYGRFTLNEDEYEVEYALIGTSKYGDEYLLARWGHTMQPLLQLSIKYEAKLARDEMERQQKLEHARKQKLKKARAHHNWALYYKSYYYLYAGLPASLWATVGVLALFGALAAANVVAIVAFFSLFVGVGFCFFGLLDDRDFIVKHIVDKDYAFDVRRGDRQFKLSDYPSVRQLKKRGDL